MMQMDGVFPSGCVIGFPMLLFVLHYTWQLIETGGIELRMRFGSKYVGDQIRNGPISSTTNVLN